MNFEWKKKGLIFDATSLQLAWATNSALTPTPVKISKEIIRVYTGFRDLEGVSRIGFVDVSMDDPSIILKISREPCLDIGRSGCFDDNGVILGDIIRYDNQFYMYYVGFQLVAKAKFLAFSGLAASQDGNKFIRISEHPILDRGEYGNMINAIHTILPLPEGGYRIWHAKGDTWQSINNKQFPCYNIWTSTSTDGIKINDDSILCIDNCPPEYRIGRPSVYLINDYFIMFYTKGTNKGTDYYPGIATSKDGVSWKRNDKLFGINLSESGWDSLHISYPRLLKITETHYYVFYSGNNMGESGFGYAELFIQ